MVKRNLFNYVNKFVSGHENCGPFNVPVWSDDGTVNDACYFHDMSTPYRHGGAKWYEYIGEIDDRVENAAPEGSLIKTLMGWKRKYGYKRQYPGQDYGTPKRHMRRRPGSQSEEKKVEPMEVNDAEMVDAIRDLQNWSNPQVRQSLFTLKGGSKARKLRSRMSSRAVIKKMPKRNYASYALRELVDTLAPQVVVVGTGDQPPAPCADGYRNFFCRESGVAGDEGSLVHGHTERWRSVFKAAKQVAASTGFDDSAINFWEYSKTTTGISNPNNHPIKVRFHEFLAVKTSNGPLALWDIVLGDTGTHLPNNAGISSSVTLGYNYAQADSGAVGANENYSKLHMKPWIGIKDFLTSYKGHEMKRLKVTKWKVLDPGTTVSYTQESRYGKIVGDEFDTLGLNSHVRYVVVEVIGYHSTNEAGALHGQQTGSVLLHTHTKDILRSLTSERNVKIVGIDNQVAGSNIPSAQQLNGTGGMEVPAGRDNVIANPS